MEIGANIKRLRDAHHLTQEQLAEKLDVSFQAVSSWERDEYLPETSKLMKLAEALNVSVSAILENRSGIFKTKDEIYDWSHMKTYIKTTARNLKLKNTLIAADYAAEKHGQQHRKNSEIPYISHPLTLACHALAMGFTDDEVIAACLLHDVVEDCGVKPEDLPVSEEIKRIVGLLSHEKTNDENREEIMGAYYEVMLQDPKAVLIKCIDRCHNISTMSWGLKRDRIYRMIRETETYYPKLLDALKGTLEYNNAAWLLKYQIESMLDIYKRLL